VYGNWADRLLSPAEYVNLLPAFCAEVGIPAGGAGFRADLEAELRHHAGECDAGFGDNTDRGIDAKGVPSGSGGLTWRHRDGAGGAR